MEVKFNNETIRLMTLFEQLTGATVKDCLLENEGQTVFYIVEEGDIGIAIGKNGSSVKRVERAIKKNIKVFEFSSTLEKFVKNLIPQAIEIRSRAVDGRNVLEIKVDKTSKAIVIGRDGKNLKMFKEIVQRIHKVDDLKVR